MLNKFNILYFIFCKQFNFVVSGLKIVGYWNPDNNLEPHCTSKMATAASSTSSPTHLSFSYSVLWN
jgi:hypothetical protein